MLTRSVVFGLLHMGESVESPQNVTELHLHQAVCLASQRMETIAAGTGWHCAFEFPRTPSAVVSRGDAIVPHINIFCGVFIVHGVILEAKVT